MHATLDLNRILKIKNCEKNLPLVSQGHSSTYASHLVNSKVVSISFDRIKNNCVGILTLYSNDLFDFVPGKDSVCQVMRCLWVLQKNIQFLRD
jgi:hypothetical protein